MTAINTSRAPAGRQPRKRLRTAAALGLLLAATSAQPQAIPQPRLPTVQLAAGMHNIVAEVASTPAQRQIGMMMRTQMAPHEGMLFVFEQPSQQCFWMRDTLLPL